MSEKYTEKNYTCKDCLWGDKECACKDICDDFTILNEDDLDEDESIEELIEEERGEFFEQWGKLFDNLGDGVCSDTE